MDFILRKAGIRYETVPLNITLQYGSLLENGTWTGYLGALQQVAQVL